MAKQQVNFKPGGIFSNLKGDFYGGITAGIISLPLCLAFGVASGLGAAAGLYGAITLGIFAALIGGTTGLISGPTGPATVAIAAMFAIYTGNPAIIFTTIFLAGIIQIILGFSKVGNMIKYVPYPVISGFMSGIGLIIIFLQITPILGLEVARSPLGMIAKVSQTFHQFDVHTLIIGFITLGIVFLTPKKVSRAIPSPLIAMVLGTLITILLGWNIDTIGNIPSGWPQLYFPTVDSLKEFSTVLPEAITLAILCSVETLLAALVSDSLTRETHNSERELIGQGVGNLLAGLFGGLAGSGAAMRTVVNLKTGGKTRLSSIIYSLSLLLILVAAAPLVEKIPMAVLAGILIKVGFDIIDYKFIKVIKHAPRYDLYVMILVFVLTVFDDLIFAVGVGIVLSSLLFAMRISQQVKIKVKDLHDHRLDKIEAMLEKETNLAIRVVHIDGVFFFGSATRVLASIDEFLGTKYLIIDCEKINCMDISAIFALEDIIIRLKDNGVQVLLVISKISVAKTLFKFDIVNLIGRKNIFFSEEKAIDYAKRLYHAELLTG